MKFILGQKVGMTRIFDENRKNIPITVVEAGPVVVTQIKTQDKDGYDAVQIGFGKRKKLTKSLKGHFKNLGSFRWLREYRIKNLESGIKIGDILDVSVFAEGDKVSFVGTSKGKGFQGVVTRHGFHGMPKTHGTKKKHRSPGSIGSRFPQHTRKGMRMAGRMGHDRVTKKTKVVKIDREHNIIALKGPIPGARGSLVEIRG